MSINVYVVNCVEISTRGVAACPLPVATTFTDLQGGASCTYSLSQVFEYVRFALDAVLFNNIDISIPTTGRKQMEFLQVADNIPTKKGRLGSRPSSNHMQHLGIVVFEHFAP
jgi:hypothetical protein